MVIDTSAIAAILFAEDDAESFERAIAQDGVRLVGAPTLFELSIVVGARIGDAGHRELDLLVTKAGIEIVAFTGDHVAVVRRAYDRFGKGNHRAALNLGDCLSYAVAKVAGEPLLFKGNDFSETDIESVTL